MDFIAHRRDGCEQSILEHLQGTARLAGSFGEVFGAGELARQCGLYHDIGKYSREFQAYIRGEGRGRVDHSTAGAMEMMKAGMVPLAFCIAGHHAGLPDAGGKGNRSDMSTLRGRCKKKDIFDYQAYRQELPQPGRQPIPGEMARDGFSYMFFTRMLFSCLTDADYLDTEQFMSGGSVRRGSFITIEEAAARFFEQLEAKGFFSPQNKINEKRADILRACLQAGKGRPGLYSLTVPTGGGKTAAATAFGLSQCQKQGLRRVIYVIPYTSIIEQTADVLRDFINRPGDKVDNIVEHHSSVDYDDPEGEEKAALKKLATENWDAPVVVTTNVQFFESLFANRTSKCRKLHNIAGSVLIFDEAQMLPSEYLRPILFSLALLVRHYGCTVLLCSATQPHLAPCINSFKGRASSGTDWLLGRRLPLAWPGKSRSCALRPLSPLPKPFMRLYRKGREYTCPLISALPIVAGSLQKSSGGSRPERNAAWCPPRLYPWGLTLTFQGATLNFPDWTALSRRRGASTGKAGAHLRQAWCMFFTQTKADKAAL